MREVEIEKEMLGGLGLRGIRRRIRCDEERLGCAEGGIHGWLVRVVTDEC